MFLKLCSGEAVADGNNSKCYQLIECDSVRFSRLEGKAFAHVFPKVSQYMETHELQGNAYVLNNSGKTIDSFSFNKFKDIVSE